jgi:hypothetical protein
MNSNVVGPNQIIKVGPMQVDKLRSKAFARLMLNFRFVRQCWPIMRSQSTIWSDSTQR